MTKLIPLALLSATTLIQGQSPLPRTVASPTYNQMISAGYDLLKEARTKEAYVAATEAAKKDPVRFESYALAALVLHTQGAEEEAKILVDKALRLVTGDKKIALNNLTKAITDSVEARRKLDVLKLIIEEADRANGEGRRKLLSEFLEQSESFLKQYPDQTSIWALRAAAAVEMDNSKAGWEAGRKLVAAGADRSDDEKMRRLIAMLDRKGWLTENVPVSKEEVLEQRRAAISGTWNCVTTSTGTEGRIVTEPFVMEVRYFDGLFESHSLGSKTNPMRTDGTAQRNGGDTFVYTWNDDKLVSMYHTKNSSFESESVGQLALRQGKLVQHGDGHTIFFNGHIIEFTEDRSCERVTAKSPRP